MQVGINDDNQEVCQLEGCTAIDPLSARCSNCGRVFCGRHISSSGHHCEGVKDAVVATCPLCNRVVPKEFPSQSVDEAVSRHMDRGCKDVPQSSGRGQVSQWPRREEAGVGRRLGGGASAAAANSWCGVTGCDNAHSKEKQVMCDRCGKGFCIEHRTPAKHDCQGKSLARTAVTSTERRSPAASPTPQATSGPVSFRAILREPANTLKTAVGKATERREDMVVPLVCFALPTSPGRPGDGAPMTFQAVSSFFMHVAKSVVVGRMLDTAIDDASRRNASTFRPLTGTQWFVHAVPVPLPHSSHVVPAMYPALPLSKYVRDTPLGNSPGKGTLTVVVISPFAELPPEVFEALKDLGNNPQSARDKDGCLIM